MLIVIENAYLAKVYSDPTVGKVKYSKEVIEKYIKAVNKLKFCDNIRDIRAFRGLNFEALKGDLKGKFSVRVDKKYRLILRIEKDEVIVEDVIVIEDLTNHYK